MRRPPKASPLLTSKEGKQEQTAKRSNVKLSRRAFLAATTAVSSAWSMGVSVVGELGNVGTAAAITHSVYHATGKRVRDLPLRLEKILA